MRRFSFIAAVAGLMLLPGARAMAQRPDSARVAFVQGMMHHHAQAIVMSRMANARTSRPDIRAAARRIIVSQIDEISLMQHWLERRNQAVPAIDTAPPDTTSTMTAMQMTGDDHAAHHVMMPGMLTPEQMRQLARGRGAKFDSLYLKGMIAHHRGAITMVAHLFAVSGATDDPEIFQLASEIDADQSAEIARMQSMQNHPPKKKK